MNIAIFNHTKEFINDGWEYKIIAYILIMFLARWEIFQAFWIHYLHTLVMNGYSIPYYHTTWPFLCLIHSCKTASGHLLINL